MVTPEATANTATAQAGAAADEGGYQQPATVVVVQQPQPWYRGPQYLRNGIRMSGVVLSFPIIICLGITGLMFLFSGIVTISMTSQFDKDFDSIFDDSPFDDDFFKKNRHPRATNAGGIIVLLIGIALICTCIGLSCYAKKKYQSLRTAGDNPGRVINPNPQPNQLMQPLNPGQPVAAPYPGGYGMQPPGVYPPTGYPQAGQPAGYPSPGGQPAVYQPAGGYPAPYPPSPGQPAGAYPPPTSMPYDAPPPYSAPSVGEKGQMLPPVAPPPAGAPNFQAQAPPSNLPGMASDAANPNAPEYTVPPPYAPGYKS